MIDGEDTFGRGGTAMDETTRLWLWLNYATNRDSRLFFDLLSRVDDLSELYDAIRQKEYDVIDDVRGTVRERLIAASDPTFLDRYCAWLQKNDVTVVTPESDAYPPLLNEIYDPPSLLFCKGRLPKELPLPIAMVGARNCTQYGRDVAELLGAEITRRLGGTYGFSEEKMIRKIAEKPIHPEKNGFTSEKSPNL